MCNSVSVWQVTACTAGQRLDVALAAFLPDLSLRARRRLWDTHTVRVNDRPRPAGWMLCEGDTVCLHPKHATNTGEAAPAEMLSDFAAFFRQSPPRVLSQHGNLIFFYKPAGLHSSHLEGRGGPSLEALLPKLYPQQAPGHTPLRLVNRLDCGTSGIVAAALSEHDADLWRRAESAGLCEKSYYALLCGHLPNQLTIRNQLDTAKRRITKILPTESFDTLRHTRFSPLGYLSAAEVYRLELQLSETVPPKEIPKNPPAHLNHVPSETSYTLALCTIAKGARHQIRAHALNAGFPLWGDPLYPPRHSLPPLASEHTFLLHHGMLSMPGVRIQCPPPWLHLLPESVRHTVQTFGV